ncbi:hypothetical protein F4811DRAFT_550101 [Daldinia bambusicola]|nr:hypothetical protein F4811DRAFT_550101 [Daldinia bambusicola]
MTTNLLLGSGMVMTPYSWGFLWGALRELMKTYTRRQSLSLEGVKEEPPELAKT